MITKEKDRIKLARETHKKISYYLITRICSSIISSKSNFFNKKNTIFNENDAIYIFFTTFNAIKI